MARAPPPAPADPLRRAAGPAAGPASAPAPSRRHPGQRRRGPAGALRARPPAAAGAAAQVRLRRPLQRPQGPRGGRRRRDRRPPRLDPPDRRARRSAATATWRSSGSGRAGSSSSRRRPRRCPFTQYRLLHDFGWEESGKNARQALKRTLLNLQEARWEGEVNDSRHRQEDPRGPLRDHRPGAVAGRPRTAASSGSATSSSAAGSSSSCATRPASTSTGTSCATSPPSPASSTACSRTTASRRARTGEEWQAYWLGPRLFASVGSTCARERDNVAALARACEAIAGHPGTGYRFSRERVAVDGGWGQQLVVWRPAGSAGRRVPRAAARAPPAERAPRRPGRGSPTGTHACMHAPARAARAEEGIPAWRRSMQA